MYFYQVFGLNFSSEILLPELITHQETNPDVVIKLGKVDRSLLKPKMPGYYSYNTPEECFFAWDEGVAFRVRAGKEIIVDISPDIEERLVRLPLLGTVFSVLLYQRGIFPLHASAVDINDEAVVVMGDKGFGKSTLVATLYGRGNNLLTDDLVGIKINEGETPLVLPSFPRVKLLPESVTIVLGANPDAFPIIAPGYEKRDCRTEKFTNKPLPLKGIYQLAKGTKLAIKPYPPQQALANLMSNSYVNGIIHQLRGSKNAVLHFRQCAQIIQSTPIYCLERPRALELVPQIAQMIEKNHQTNLKLARVN